MNGQPWYEIRADSGAVAEIWIYEEIGENFWGEGLTAKQFVRDLAALDVDQINLHINSPGGNVFDGQAIYTALRQHPATVTTYIDGLAASIASVVALAGDRVVMAGNALFMIHMPSGMAMGTAAEMRAFADLLDKVADTAVGIYVAKTGLDADDVRGAMAEESWYSATEAEELGYADEVAEPLKLAALMNRFDFSRFRHAPRSLTESIQNEAAAEASSPAPAAEAAARPKRLFVPSAHQVLHFGQE